MTCFHVIARAFTPVAIRSFKIPEVRILRRFAPLNDTVLLAGFLLFEKYLPSPPSVRTGHLPQRGRVCKAFSWRRRWPAGADEVKDLRIHSTENQNANVTKSLSLRGAKRRSNPLLLMIHRIPSIRILRRAAALNDMFSCHCEPVRTLAWDRRECLSVQSVLPSPRSTDSSPRCGSE